MLESTHEDGPEEDDEDEEPEDDEEQPQGSEAQPSADHAVAAATEAMEALDILDDDGLFGTDRAPEEWERENVEKCLRLFGLCSDLMKALLAAVDEAVEERGGEEGAVMAVVAKVEDGCQALGSAVMNAADALYPPQAPQELSGGVGNVVEAAVAAVGVMDDLPQGRALQSCQEILVALRAVGGEGVSSEEEA